jgi:hypothetical protein
MTQVTVGCVDVRLDKPATDVVWISAHGMSQFDPRIVFIADFSERQIEIDDWLSRYDVGVFKVYNRFEEIRYDYFVERRLVGRVIVFDAFCDAYRLGLTL